VFHERKHGWMGCAIATTATIADLTYEEVASLADGVSPEELRDTEELQRLLTNITRIRWVWRGQRRVKTVSQTLFPEYPVAVCLQDRARNPRFGQWVAARGQLIHDPALSAAYRISEYPCRYWYVSHLLEPAEPEELKRRKRPRSSFVLRELAAEIRLEQFRMGNEHEPVA